MEPVSRPSSIRSTSAPNHVGRKSERAELAAALTTVADGCGLLLCVSGDAGLGKSSLVEGFLDEVRQSTHSCQVARGRCSERLAGAEAYLPLFEILEDLVHGDHGEAASRALKAIAPTWYVHVVSHPSDDASTHSLIADTQIVSQERMKREILALFQELTRVRPLVVFLDDLHWIDLATLDVLSFLAARFHSLRLLFVATFRPSELQLASHPFLPFCGKAFAIFNTKDLKRMREEGRCAMKIATQQSQALCLCTGWAWATKVESPESLECLHEGLRQAELNDERYWLPRIPNTIGWIHRELEDHEAAIKWDTDNIAISRELEWSEAEANARVNPRAGDLAKQCKRSDEADDYHRRARSIIHSLFADRIADGKLRDHFVKSKCVSELGAP